MSNIPISIVIVDDDASIRHALANLLRAAAFDVLAFSSAEDFLDARDGERIDCLIADINLPGMSGVALLETLAATGRAIPSVLITARDDRATLSMIQNAKYALHLHKPFSDEELFTAIDRVIRR